MSHLTGTSSITTRANNQFPGPVFHRLDTQHYGLRADYADCADSESVDRVPVKPRASAQSAKSVDSIGHSLSTRHGESSTSRLGHWSFSLAGQFAPHPPAGWPAEQVSSRQLKVEHGLGIGNVTG